MTIWVDADSCPVRVREIIAKRAFKLSVVTVFVANREIPLNKNQYIKSVVTNTQEQAADNYILSLVKEGDLVVTRDIPLASQLVALKIAVINDRGGEFTSENIRERLSLRNFMYEIRFFGLDANKNRQFTKKDVQNFSNTFDKVITKLLKNENIKKEGVDQNRTDA